MKAIAVRPDSARAAGNLHAAETARGVGSATPKVMPTHPAADGRTPTTAKAAGMAIRNAIRRLRVVAGRIPTTEKAAGTVMKKVTAKQRSAAGNPAIAASAVVAPATTNDTGWKGAQVPFLSRINRMLQDLLDAFMTGFHGSPSRTECVHADKEIRDHLNERQVDKMVEDSFPASDPPSTY